LSLSVIAFTPYAQPVVAVECAGLGGHTTAIGIFQRARQAEQIVPVRQHGPAIGRQQAAPDGEKSWFSLTVPAMRRDY